MWLRLVGASLLGFGSAMGTVQCAPPPPAFSPTEFRKFTLVHVSDESHNAKVFRFAYPEGDMTGGLTCASFVVLRATIDGKEVVRPYTPISRVNQAGYCEVMVKKYKGSAMGTHLHALKRGDSIEIKGPFVKIPLRPRQYRAIGMLAGGTGITPMFQVIQELVDDPKNTTDLSLVYASRKKEDVLLGNELNRLMETHPDKLQVYYVLSQPPPTWMGGMGHIDEAMIRAFMPPPTKSDGIVLVCGPPSFMAAISGDKDFKSSAQGEIGGLLRTMGYSPKQVFKF